MREPASFGARLRQQREERGISLRSIADSTKVSASYYSALERGDCARWPAGVYSRAFVRGYAEAIGLDPDTVASDFFQCFPELATPPEQPASGRGATAPNGLLIASTRTELRLVLAEAPSERAREHAARLLRAVAGLAAVLLAAAIIGSANGRFWMTLSIALITRQIVIALIDAPRAQPEPRANDDDTATAPLHDAELAG